MIKRAASWWTATNPIFRATVQTVVSTGALCVFIALWVTT